MERLKLPPSGNHIYDELLDRIVNLKYPPMHHLVEDSLAEEFGVSRSPIRKVLAMLEADGFITSFPAKGCYVATDLKMCHIQHLLRREIDTAAVTLIAQRDDLSFMDELMTMAVELDNIFSRGGYEEQPMKEFLFHRRLAELSGNPYLLKFVDKFATNILFSLNLQSQHYMALNMKEANMKSHETICNAIIFANKSKCPEIAVGSIHMHYAIYPDQIYDMQLWDEMHSG